MRGLAEYDGRATGLAAMERRWLQDCVSSGEPWQIRELDGGATYLHLPQVGSISGGSRVRWVGIVLGLSALVIAPAIILLLLGEELLATLVPLVLLFVVTLWLLVRVMRMKPEAGDPRHGLLLTPDAIVLNRSEGITRIPREAITNIDDDTRLRSILGGGGDYVSTPQSAHRRILIHFTDDGAYRELVVADVEGDRTVIRGAKEGHTALQTARLDAVKARLDAWMEEAVRG